MNDVIVLEQYKLTLLSNLKQSEKKYAAHAAKTHIR